jgi:hypothetical protein
MGNSKFNVSLFWGFISVILVGSFLQWISGGISKEKFVVKLIPEIK